ncbi:MAG: adenylate/guanylate cyclase domain-containing protein, partial [Saprospiraceae bacterium]|nr:adenylate/guanylate cyclase domain-containing protein [Saprospiraceae bacterium]
RIGNRRFFELLKEVYFDITEPILESLGEIYQYVGDEVVVTWPVKKGVQENNCLACFFRIARKMEANGRQYLSRYEVMPTFKAGVHVGRATVGEIGVIKKDIVYSGDVLNTTSRIQSLCNDYQADLLVSSDLLSLLQLGSEYTSSPIGEISLRGKEEKVGLHTIAMPPTYLPNSNP